MSVKQKELYDLVSKIEEYKVPKAIKMLQIFVIGDFATEEELEAIRIGEEQIANGEFYTQAEIEEMFNIE